VISILRLVSLTKKESLIFKATYRHSFQASEQILHGGLVSVKAYLVTDQAPTRLHLDCIFLVLA